MNKEELIQKITEKKEFSQLPLKDVELALEKFDKPRNAEYQKIKLTRQFLRKIFSSFSSRKILSVKEKDVDWYLGKHKSSKERMPYYAEIYKRIFGNYKEKFTLIDLGAGINALSYEFIRQLGFNPRYIAVEAMGQFVELSNWFFKKERVDGESFQLSLFELDKIKEIIKKQKSPRIVLLFKVIDSLEIVKRNYSKELLKEIVPLADKIIVSFATKSLGSRKRFSASRGWLLRFIQENFHVLDDFELGGERYITFKNKFHLI